MKAFSDLIHSLLSVDVRPVLNRTVFVYFGGFFRIQNEDCICYKQAKLLKIA